VQQEVAMNATVRFGRVRGIEIGAHWSVLIIGALLAYGLTGGVVDGALWATVVPMVVIFLSCLLAHELGHSIVALRNGVRVRRITLWMLGGVAQLEDRIPTAGATFRIAAAGPAVSYALAAFFFGVRLAIAPLGAPDLMLQAVEWLAFVNVVLGTFNLIPAAPLDGGRILTGAIWAATKNRTKAEVAATRIGQGLGIAFIGLGLAGTFFRLPFFTLWTAVMGVFVLRVATAEQRFARAAGAYGDRAVRDVMTPEPETVRGWMTVQTFLDEIALLPARHHLLPVVAWSGEIMGVVGLDALERVPVGQRNTVRVQDLAVPREALAVAGPDEPLLDAAGRIGRSPVRVLLVFAEHVLVGIVTPGDLQRTTPGALTV
jgi:Zn-dependent protease